MTASDPSQSVDVVCRNIDISVKQIIHESFVIVRQETSAHIYHHVVVILRKASWCRLPLQLFDDLVPDAVYHHTRPSCGAGNPTS